DRLADKGGELFARILERAHIAADDALAEKSVVDRIDGRCRLRRYLGSRFTRYVFAAVGVLENRQDDHCSVAGQLSQCVGKTGEIEIGEILDLEVEIAFAKLRLGGGLPGFVERRGPVDDHRLLRLGLKLSRQL